MGEVLTLSGWICSYAHGDLRPCHAPATYVVRRGDLTVGACDRHLAEITESLTPKIEVTPIEEAMKRRVKEHFAAQ